MVLYSILFVLKPLFECACFLIMHKTVLKCKRGKTPWPLYWSCSKLKYGVFYTNIYFWHKKVLFIRSNTYKFYSIWKQWSYSFNFVLFKCILLIMCYFFLNCCPLKRSVNYIISWFRFFKLPSTVLLGIFFVCLQFNK